MKIYVDIDFVLYDYAPAFYSECLNHFKPLPSKTPKNICWKKSYKNPLDPYIKAFNLSEELTMELVLRANERDLQSSPTPYTRGIEAFIKSKKLEGHQPIAVTARSTRMNAEKIVKMYLGEDVPVVTVDTSNKHFIMEEGSIYFEDHPKAIIPVIENKNDILVVVPKWPWNLDLKPHRNILHINSDEIIKLKELTEERMCQYA